MAREVAVGLTGDWLNGWLAAIGVTVLLPQVRLSWSGDPIPIARFDYADAQPLASIVAEALPTPDALADLAAASLKRNVNLEAFREAAEASRRNADGSLACSVSDLLSGKSFEPTNLPHGAFDPPAPKGTTLSSRVVLCRKLLGPDLEEQVSRALEGSAERVQANGLGFDVRRLPSGVQPDAKVMVDAVVECLCFVALELFPVRGDGRQCRQRGWSGKASERGSFNWPVWSDPLDVWGIDALLDRFHADRSRSIARRLGISGAFGSVPFRRKSDQDTTRAYGSERIEVA